MASITQPDENGNVLVKTKNKSGDYVVYNGVQGENATGITSPNYKETKRANTWDTRAGVDTTPVNEPVTPTQTPTQTTTTSNYYNDLLEKYRTQSEQSRQDTINAIMKNLEAVKSSYASQQKDVESEYDNLIDQNEVKKYLAQRVLRENQANRGQLNSGLGRQENLIVNNKYDTQTSNLSQAKQKAIDDIANLIIQAESEAEINKANTNNEYANALLEYELALASNS